MPIIKQKSPLKRWYIFMFFFLVGTVSLYAQVFNQTMTKLPDTGQEIDDKNLFGEDGDYQLNSPSFTVHANGTITDNVTELMWQQTDGGEMTYEDAQAYVDTLTLGGYTDWRLPNINESVSILNLNLVNPSLDTNVFTLTDAQYWWCNEARVDDVNKIWCTNAGGGQGAHAKTETVSTGGKCWW